METNDDVAEAREVLAVVAVLLDAVAVDEAAAVQPHEHGPLLAVAERGREDVEPQAVLADVVVVPVVAERRVACWRSGSPCPAARVLPHHRAGSTSGPRLRLLRRHEAVGPRGVGPVGDAEEVVDPPQHVAADLAVLRLGEGDVVADEQRRAVLGVRRAEGRGRQARRCHREARGARARGPEEPSPVRHGVAPSARPRGSYTCGLSARSGARRGRRRAARSGPRRARAPDRRSATASRRTACAGSRANACWISAGVFITNGPCCATGSPIGRPCSSRSSRALGAVLEQNGSDRRAGRRAVPGGHLAAVRRAAPCAAKKYSVRLRARARPPAASTARPAPCASSRSRRRCRAARAHECGGGAAGAGVAEPAGDDRDLGACARRRPSRRAAGSASAPQHREVRRDQLVGARQVQPDLEQLERVRPRRARAAGTSPSARCRRRR